MKLSDEDTNRPDADGFQQELKDFIGKMGATPVAFPGFSPPQDNQSTTADEEPHSDEDALEIISGFHYKPRDIKAYLDRFVIKQDEAKKALAIAVCDHYNHAKARQAELERKPEAKPREVQKQNVIIVGPTGVGKTYLVKHIAELIGVPFVKADATKFSETGYVGGDVDDLVRELIQGANGNVDLAEFGIIYIDEIDKLATRGGMIGRDVSGRGVQTTLLKLMEETEVPVSNPMDMKSQMKAMMNMGRGSSERETINTRHILFIVSGAFSGLEDILEKRLGAGQIGFQASKTNERLLETAFRQVETQDFIDFGFEAEFIGRLPIRVVCEHLTSEDLFNIMKNSEGSLLRQYEQEFAAYGIRARFSEPAIRQIAKQAEKEKTGARALMTVCERLLRDFKFELPGTAVTELKIDDDLIENREKRLEEYRHLGQVVDLTRVKDEIQLFASDFLNEHGLELIFDDEALEEIRKLSQAQGRSVLQTVGDLFDDYKFGLKLVEKNTGRKQFKIDAETIRNPDKTLSNLVVKSYAENASLEGKEDS